MLCRLCERETKLEVSHIVPKFIYKWLKDTSATGFIRCGLEPNKRVQDGFKEEFLCPECEDLFCNWETEFSKAVFHPLVSKQTHKFRYSEWMLKFTVSLSWRVLKYMLEKHELPHFNDAMTTEAHNALKQWEQFLLGKQPHPGRFQQHVIPLDQIDSATKLLPLNINRYLLRSVDLDAVTSGEQAYVYIKLPYVLVIGFIHIKRPDDWRGAKVHVKNGVLGSEEYLIPEFVIDHLIEKAERSDEIKDKFSDKQNEKIVNAVRNNVERVRSSGTLDALKGDVSLHGNKVFNRKKPANN